MSRISPLAIAAVALGLARAAAADDGTVLSLAGKRLPPPSHDRHVDFQLDLSAQQAFLRLPADVAPDGRIGLVVYIPSKDGLPPVPDGWTDVLDAHHLAFAGVAGAGNGQLVSRRGGLAVATAGRVMALHKVDPARVYVAGLSGGARVAGLVGFYQPDLFRGTVQCCGADYWRQVPHADPATQRQVGPVLLVDGAEGARAKLRVRFALITGDRDFNRALVSETFHGGFEPDHFTAKLFDVPGMGHRNADGPTFAAAIAFLEQPDIANRATSRPTVRHP